MKKRSLKIMSVVLAGVMTWTISEIVVLANPFPVKR